MFSDIRHQSPHTVLTLILVVVVVVVVVQPHPGAPDDTRRRRRRWTTTTECDDDDGRCERGVHDAYTTDDDDGRRTTTEDDGRRERHRIASHSPLSERQRWVMTTVGDGDGCSEMGRVRAYAYATDDE
jgi:hypothetical protein